MSVPVNGLVFHHKFIVAEQIIAVAILSLDFLEDNKCLLDLAGGNIQIQGQAIPLTGKTTLSKAKVTVLKKVTIPPQSEMEILAHIHSDKEGTWLLEGTDFKHLPMCVARALIIPKGQTVPIHVVNLDPAPVTLYKTLRLQVQK